MITKEQLQSILYSHRFQPYDSVSSLIESLIKHLAANDPTFNDTEFRLDADYPYDSNGHSIGEHKP